MSQGCYQALDPDGRLNSYGDSPLFRTVEPLLT